MSMRRIYIAVFMMASVCVTGLDSVVYADNVEIKLGSGDGFKVQDSSGASLMDITSSGNVGIGTTGPQNLLHIHENSTGASRIGITNTDTGSALTDGLHIGLDTDESAFVWQLENNHLRFATNNQERVRITSNGYVGIGTTSPSSLLHIEEATTGAARIVVKNTTTGGATAAGIKLDNTDSAWDIFTSTDPGWGGFEDELIFSGENGWNLAVIRSGDVNVRGCIAFNGGSNGTCLSDKRMKKDIRSFELGLQETLNINPIYYKYNGLGGSLDTDNEKIGVIAQEVERVAPEIVGLRKVKLYDEDEIETEVKTVNYSAFTYMLVNSVKELYGMIIDQTNGFKEHDLKITSQEKIIKVFSEENKWLRKEIQDIKTESYTVKRENKHLKEDLLSLTERLETIETMLLVENTIPKEILAKADDN